MQTNPLLIVYCQNKDLKISGIFYAINIFPLAKKGGKRL